MAKKCIDTRILYKNLCFCQENVFKMSPNFVFSQFPKKIINLHHLSSYTLIFWDLLDFAFLGGLEEDDIL